MKIGIDFGGVIVKSAIGGASIDLTAGLDLMVPGAFEGIAELVSMSEGKVWIVSKASHPTRVATRHWLDKTRFHQVTGFAPGNIHFCEKRQEKRAICESLGLTHFIDDSPDVIRHITEVVPNVYRFGSDTVCSWPGLLAAIRSSIHAA
ncbi:MAG: hypothetical protein V4710_09215 [Verrucomicrobiota bacterium]